MSIVIFIYMLIILAVTLFVLPQLYPEFLYDNVKEKIENAMPQMQYAYVRGT
jgi:hypothetical protein